MSKIDVDKFVASMFRSSIKGDDNVWRYIQDALEEQNLEYNNFDGIREKNAESLPIITQKVIDDMVSDFKCCTIDSTSTITSVYRKGILAAFKFLNLYDGR